MTLYFETPVLFKEANVISTNQVWHPNAPLLAIASYSQDRGGFVGIFDELGEPLKEVTFPVHAVSQVTSLVWHPERNMLVIGWENGEIRAWNGVDKEFVNVAGPHKAPVILLEFSQKGGRLVSCDSTGSLVGWKVDSKNQMMTVFHHELKESITHLTFRLTVRNHGDYDIEGLAKAAVNGDEQALDIFSSWRPKTTARKFKVQDSADNNCFFVGTQQGSVYYINDGGVCREVLNTDAVPLNYILHHPINNTLIIMMEGLTIGHFAIDSQGQLSELMKVKLSGRGQALRGVSNQGLVWATNTCLAVLTGDLTVRVWDIESNDNYILPTELRHFEKVDSKPQLNEHFSCISFCKVNQTLCAGTNIGRIYFWRKKQARAESVDPNDCVWELHNLCNISGTIKQLVWGSVNFRLPLLSVNCVTKVYIMKEQNLCTCFSESIWATQRTASQILLETLETSSVVNTDMQVTDMSINRSYIAVTNGRFISVYDIVDKDHEKITYEVSYNAQKKNEKKALGISLINNFSCDNEGIILFGKSIVILTPAGVLIKAHTGSNIFSIPSTPAEGEPIGIDVTSNYLTVFTMEGYLKIYDLSETEPKVITPIRSLYDMCTDFGEIIQAKANSNGSKVALTLAAANLVPDGKLYVWDVEQDNLNLSYDFRKFNCSKSNTYEDFRDICDELIDDDADETTALYNKICTNRIPLSLHWDNEDARLLICNAKKLKSSGGRKPYLSLYGKEHNENKTAVKRSLEDEDQVVITMFISTDHGIRIQDIKAIDAESKLIGLATPFMVVLSKHNIERVVMNDFNGLEKCNKATKEAILDFSYNLSLGNMDAAFKAIKLIQSAGVWQSLARMCVKTRRLDVASVCLGHMGDAKAARALRLAVADASLPIEAKIAVLAIQLNMLDEAEKLYMQCERYDLLNKFYQSRNRMDEALTVAESNDRIHLKNTEHMYAQMLEQNGNLREAVYRYERANTHVQEIPRMLVEQPDQLEVYMSTTTEPELLKWWGQYIESQGDLNGALRTYAKAGDIYNQVRTLCFMEEEGRATELTRANTDKAAFYHMARHYETLNNIKQSVEFFKKANAYSNAVRLCKENNMGEELWSIALVAGRQEKLECARYFEEVGDAEKAIMCYHRAGMFHKALDLAFKFEQFDVLQQVAVSLDWNSDPALIKKCADFFVANEQYDKAVDLLAVGKHYIDAINICLSHNVQLTEDLVEKLTPEKEAVDETTKNKILESLAESLMIQGHYQLATKKFTQAGDRVRAMKALLKSGDTDKIIFFAGVSRQREIYIMAANYLQSLDWQNKPEVLRNIITFYSKGKAQDLLANFYVACAQIEIDEFQNYEKAYGALTEASRCLTKIPNASVQHEKASEVVKKRMVAIKRFIDIRRLFERGDIDNAITQSRQFLVAGGPDLEESVRRGDVYALMIHHYVKNQEFLEAKQVLTELRQVLSSSGNVPITYYVNKELIEALAAGLGTTVGILIPSSSKLRSSVSQDQGEGEIEEEVN
ncbi:hypothetical protein PPYR_13387 [Photinus pyralis]|uniref:Uncharacterized protein n=1 Tax=Photinus pyralis TaxID=7054 RepID=A0A5N4A8Y2_PHOPY|nr:intraflagellar transport protein 140 homolog [Photinus pyralis]KAB0793767.1 hypothetical protein PPYR_13387 [Photinus pyralis]